MPGITRMGLYKNQKQQSRWQKQVAVVIALVKNIKIEQPRLSVRKLQVVLKDDFSNEGIKIGRDGLFDLLREFDMLVKPKRYRHYCTDSKHQFRKYPNQVKGLKPTASNQLWVSDMTYIEEGAGFNYLSLITDAYSRKIVGHCLSDSYSVAGTIAALKKALKENKTKSGLIHHSDRGIQYCSKEYTSILKSKGAIISMTENGSPYENAMAERVNGILKTELLQKKYESRKQAVKAIDKAVKIYNNKRPHLSIGMLTPEEAHKTKRELKMMWKKKNYSKPFKEAVPCSFNGADPASLNSQSLKY